MPRRPVICPATKLQLYSNRKEAVTIAEIDNGEVVRCGTCSGFHIQRAPELRYSRVLGDRPRVVER